MRAPMGRIKHLTSNLAKRIARRKSMLRRNKRIAMLAVAVTLGCLPSQGVQSAAASTPMSEIWFTPMQNAVLGNGRGVTIDQHDFLLMLSYPEQWSQAASHISEITLDIVHYSEGKKLP